MPWAKLLDYIDWCGSLAHEGGWSDRSYESGVEAVASALPGQPVHENMPRQER